MRRITPLRTILLITILLRRRLRWVPLLSLWRTILSLLLPILRLLPVLRLLSILRLLTILSLRCLLAVWRLSSLRRERRLLSVLSRWRSSVLPLLGSTVLALGSAILTLGSTILTLWRASVRWLSTSGPIGFLVLGIVARIDGAEEELAQPQVGGQVHRWVSARHLVLLNLEVGGGVDELANSGLVVEFTQELACLEVIAYLRKLVAYGALAVWRAGELVGGVTDGVKDGSGGFTGGLAVGDCNDEDRLAELVGANFLDDEGVEDLVA